MTTMRNRSPQIKCVVWQDVKWTPYPGRGYLAMDTSKWGGRTHTGAAQEWQGARAALRMQCEQPATMLSGWRVLGTGGVARGSRMA